jgi:DNA repair exonuclease SbcCD nuclease subunit
MLKFLHTSDWHLGMRRHFLGDESGPRFQQARIDAIASLARLAWEHGCAFMLVAGDTLDSNQVDPRTLGRALQALREFPVPVYLIPGNHDAADASSMLCSPRFQEQCPPHVHVLAEPGATEVAPGVELVAVPWRTRRPLTDLVADACAHLQQGPIRIVLAHGAVDTLSPDDGNPALVSVAAMEAALAAGRVHYVALGDRHTATAVGATGRIWYSGSPEPTQYDQEPAGTALVVSLERDACDVATLRTGSWRFMRLVHAFAGDDDVEALDRALTELPAKERTVVRLTLTGTLSLAGHARLEAVLAAQGHLFASLTRSDRRSELAVMPAESDFSQLQLTGFASQALDTLRVTAEQNGADAAAARDALALMVRLAGRSA